VAGAGSPRPFRRSKGANLGKTINKGCVTLAMPITLKSILRQKENYGNSNISPRKNIILKNPLKETKILQNITTLQLISSFNTRQNIIFQKSSYKIHLLPRGHIPP
jgi:hypothetical protein